VRATHGEPARRGAEADVTTTAGQLLPTIRASGAILDPEIVLEAIAYGEDPRVVAHDTRLDLSVDRSFCCSAVRDSFR
jgi:hypothetical protein